MFSSGHRVADALSVSDTQQIQPNGVDIRVAEIQSITGIGEISTDGKKIADRAEVEPVSRQGTQFYDLTPGEYIVVYEETVRIPEDSIGFVFPRSSLIRNGVMLYTAVWDAGYEGKGEGLLKVDSRIRIEPESRIGQLVLANAETEELYDGSYQGERLDTE